MATTRVRSPNYPIVDLQVAVGLSEKMYKEAQRHQLPIATVKTGVWELKPKSSAGEQLIAALKSFGLIEVIGSGEQRQLRVTPGCAKILENHPERGRLLQDAALAPKVHRAIWNHFSKSGTRTLPPDATLQHYLLFDHDPPFNKDSIAAFLKQFRASLLFASINGLDDAFGGDVGDDEHEEQPEPSNDVVQRVQRESAERQTPELLDKSGSRMNRDVFSLPEGDATLQWPAQLSATSYEDLVAWLDLMKRKLGRSVQSS